MENNKDDEFGLLTWVAIVAALVFVGITRWNINGDTGTADIVETDQRTIVADDDASDTKTKVAGLGLGVNILSNDMDDDDDDIDDNDLDDDDIEEEALDEDDMDDDAPKTEEKAIIAGPERYTYFVNKGYTKIRSYTDFAPNELVTRGQGANYLAVYGDENNLEEKTPFIDCQFSDLDQTEGDPAVDKMTQSCLYGLMRGSNGKFIQSRIMKTSEVLAVLVRTEKGYLDETTDPRFLNYFEEAKTLGILGQSNDITTFDKEIDRKTFASWVYSWMKKKGE